MRGPRLGTSGIIWRPNLILTSSEGIWSEDDIKVLFPGGGPADARLLGSDPGTDLAILEADAGLKVGQLVLAVERTADTGPIASFGIGSGVSGNRGAAVGHARSS